MNNEEIRKKLQEYWGYPHPQDVAHDLVRLVTEIASLSRQEGVREVLGKVGFLRQALNEDRITDPKKMIDDEYIKHWLR